MLSNEAALRKALCTKLERFRWFTQKLEAEGMNAGIPDLIIGRNYVQMFVELKLEKTAAPSFDKGITVHWRPGQQAWAVKYYKSVRKCVWNLIQYNDRLALVYTGASVYKDNKVPASDIKWFKNLDSFCDWVTGVEE